MARGSSISTPDSAMRRGEFFGDEFLIGGGVRYPSGGERCLRNEEKPKLKVMSPKMQVNDANDFEMRTRN
jgi:hypothetical protein